MHAKPDLRVVLKWMIYRSGSVITDVILLRQMPKLSILTLFWLTLYFAICASIYVTQNSAAGWAIVIATALLIAKCMIYAFDNRNSFALGFSVFAMSWALLCFGYSFDSSRAFAGWQFQRPIFNAMRLGRTSPEIDSFATAERYKIHSFFRSDDAMRHPEDSVKPTYGNAMRCFACLSAMVVGLFGGALFQFIKKPPNAG